MDRPVVPLSLVQDPYVALGGKVLAHVGEASSAVELAQRSDGVIVRAGPPARECRIAGGPSKLVGVDWERYVSDRRSAKIETLEMFPEQVDDSVDALLRCGASILLAPSRFPADRSDAQIHQLLETGAAFVDEAGTMAPGIPSFVPVVIRFDELVDGRWVEPIRSSGLPIATVFAGFADPLATARQLEGALRIMEAAAIAFPVRCDISVAGLIANDASLGAIGSTSTVRHLMLPRPRKKVTNKEDEDKRPSIFVPRFASWMKPKFIEQAMADTDLDELFRCGCATCGERGDVRNLTLPGVNQRTWATHSVTAAVDLSHRVIGADDPISAWLGTCREALDAYDELHSLGISGPAKPGAISAWLEVLG